jgi:acetyltransferase-like isoleucine patch superfamily enzyme
LKAAAKFLIRGLCLMLIVLPAALSAFGRIKLVYTFFAQAYALIPGIPGDYMRSAYYFMTLRSCSLECQIGFGSYFSQPEATVARGVGIGAYCVIGRANLGEGCRLGSMVQVLSGQHQHVRDAAGHLAPGELSEINIGADSWIGASSIIMADVGARATISAGTVVSVPVPAGTTAAGNPARFIRASEA